jgi:L-lactate dehydrogenase complex protein LldE
VEATGAEVVIATDAGCLMNVGGRLRRRGSAVKTVHLAEVLSGQ